MIGRLACLALSGAGLAFALPVGPLTVETDRLWRSGVAIERGGAVAGARELLAGLDHRSDPPCTLDYARNLAVIATAIDRMDADGAPLGPDTRERLERALACRPADGLGWALLAEWHLDAGDIGPAIEAIGLSRRFAPREGHILLRRQFMSWPVFDLMPAEERERTLDEFALLVEGRYFPEAYAIIAEEGPQRSEEFSDAMIGVSLLSRQLFASFLAPRTDAVRVPGIGRPEPRAPRAGG